MDSELSWTLFFKLILVDIFRGGIFVNIFHEFSRTFFVHENSSTWMNFRGHFWVNSSEHFLTMIRNSANTVGHSTQRVRSQVPARISKHCSMSG